MSNHEITILLDFLGRRITSYDKKKKVRRNTDALGSNIELQNYYSNSCARKLASNATSISISLVQHERNDTVTLKLDRRSTEIKGTFSSSWTVCQKW